MATEADAAMDVDGATPDDATQVDQNESNVEPVWREDWREQIAGDDEKALKRLQRLQSPADIFKSYRALEQKLSSGEVKASLPEGATDDQVAEWRKDNGIPEAPEGYLEKMPGGVVIGEEDKPIVEDFLKSMHAKNASPEHVGEAIAWYQREREQRIAALAEEDASYAQSSEDELRGEWGNEYRLNENRISALLDTAPEGLADALKGGRLGDGSPLFANPDMKRWLVSLATQVNPAGTLMPGMASNKVETLQTRKAEIETMMRTNRRSYERNADVQAEYREILDVLSRTNNAA